MTKKAFGVTCLALAVSGAVGLFSAYIHQQNYRRANEAAKPVPDLSIQSELPESDYSYVIRVYQGKVAVFLKDAQAPEMLLEVPLRTLPTADQQALAVGILVPDYPTLIARIEDFIS